MVVAPVGDYLRDEGLDEAAGRRGRHVVGSREGEIYGCRAAALSKQLVERLPEKFGCARLRRGEEDDALLFRLRRSEARQLAQVFDAPNKCFGRVVRKYPPRLC